MNFGFGEFLSVLFLGLQLGRLREIFLFSQRRHLVLEMLLLGLLLLYLIGFVVLHFYFHLSQDTL